MSQAHFYQHIYTSSRVKRGYYTIRISQEVKNHIAQLERKGIYKSPKGNFPSRPDEEELKNFPVQFTHYLLEETGQSVFCRAVYRGRDNHSRSPRYGNYFSHSIILQEHLPEGLLPFELFKNFPWEEKLDIADDVSGSEAVREQIGAKSLALENSIDQYISDLRFLFESGANREAIFLQLVDLVVNGVFQKDKKILIIEEEEYSQFLPKWMNCLCLVFPPKYYREFSFSSYYRDPLNCHSKIIGTVSQEGSMLQFNGDEPSFCVFDTKVPTEPIIQNNYTKQIKEVLQQIKAGRLDQAGRLLQKTFNYIIDEDLNRIGPEFNRPFDFLKDLSDMLKKDEVVFEKDILPFFQKYPKRSAQIEDELKYNRQDMFAELLKHKVRKGEYRDFESVYEELIEKDGFKERYINDLFGCFVDQQDLSLENSLNLIEKFGNDFDLVNNRKLFENVFTSFISQDPKSELNEGRRGLLKRINEELFEEIKCSGRYELVFRFWNDLRYLKKINNNKDSEGELIFILKELIQHWENSLNEFSGRETVVWLEEVYRIIHTNKLELRSKDINLESIDFFDAFFSRNSDLREVQSLKKELQIDVDLVKFNNLLSDWEGNKKIISESFVNIDEKKKHEALVDLSHEQQKFLLEHFFKFKFENFQDFNLQKIPLFFNDYLVRYDIEKLPFVEKLMHYWFLAKKEKGNTKIYNEKAKAEIAKSLIFEDSVLDRTTAEFLGEKASHLFTEVGWLPPDHRLIDRLLWINQKYGLNISFPVIEYKKAVRRLAYREKDDLYDLEGLEKFISEHREVEKDHGDLVQNILNKIIKNRFNFEDFLQLFAVFKRTDISEESYMSAINSFIEKYYNSQSRLGDRNWLKEQLIIAVLLSNDKIILENLIKFFNVRELFKGNGLDYRNSEMLKRIDYMVKNQTSRKDLWDRFMKEIGAIRI